MKSNKKSTAFRKTAERTDSRKATAAQYPDGEKRGHEKKIIGKFPNEWLANLVGGLCLPFKTAGSVNLLYLQFFSK